MKHSTVTLAMLTLIGGVARAQNPLANAKKAAQGARSASDAQTAAMQKPEAAMQQPAAKAQQPVPPAPGAKAPAGNLPQTTAKPGTALAVAKADTAGPPPTIYRELFAYARDNRRDPFVSLLTTNELRPTLSDLKLTGILYDHTGRNSVASFRDLTNHSQYRASVGSVLGRMRVTAIHVGSVVFTIDEFGTTRRDSLVLRDSTNRARR